MLIERPRPALLVLEDGELFMGEAFGGVGTATGEVVFNTGLTGYQEVLTDPSYHRQLVAMTTPHQGNYGTTELDAEAARVQVGGFIVRSASRMFSNWRATGSLHDELARAGVVGITEVDTRRLARHIRSAGAMRAGISSEIDDRDALLAQVRRAPSMRGADLAREVSTPEVYDVDVADPQFRVVAYDFGIKRNILRLLTDAGCAVRVVPATTSPEQVLAWEPDGIFCSNGPGDPAAVTYGIAALGRLLAAGLPVFGICLGHQLLGHAVGATTYKLPFGHRGTNQPVRNAARGTVEISTHNHGFAVDADSLADADRFGRVTASHVNLNDGVNEGLLCHDVPAFSVQYHPEAAPGPHDARYLFSDFTALMRRTGRGTALTGVSAGSGGHDARA
ncbi:MAG TPA: glutamine-hydrolyzing carbamoyl-phosphate synthase small subunit [Euzebyales bacterium]|nr:glutamine-hydrolyzing carbamoyl-phosphate synthase small subunit [Euzebyales bacterium]